MKRTHSILAVALGCVLFAALAGGCNRSVKLFQDGTYTAEFANYDSYGYKDFVKAVVKDGVVTELVYDGKSEDGMLKTENTKYESDMQALQDTYPVKYTTDLENQYLESQDIDGVDALAGATYSSESFVALFTALEANMQTGDTTTLVVENVPER